MKKVSAEQIQENLDKFYSYIDQYVSEDRKDKLKTFYKGIEETLRSEEHTSELQSLRHLVCSLLLEKQKL